MEQRPAASRLANIPIVSGFKAFLVKQNILSLAVAVVIGAALGVVVKAVVDDFIMPIIAVVLPSGDWQKATWAVGPVRFGIGNFTAAVLNFLIVGFVAWRITKAFIVTVTPPATKTCTFCRMAIDPAATRCPHCTSELSAA